MKNRKLILCDRRKKRSRYKLKSSNLNSRLRISCTKSNRYLYVQLIDDANSRTILANSTLDSSFDSLLGDHFNKKNRIAAECLGKVFAKQLIDIGIKDNVVFDRGSYAYQGVIASLSDSMRNSGLIF